MALGDGAFREMLHASRDLDDALAALALLVARSRHTYSDSFRVFEDRFAGLSVDGHANWFAAAGDGACGARPSTVGCGRACVATTQRRSLGVSGGGAVLSSGRGVLGWEALGRRTGTPQSPASKKKAGSRERTRPPLRNALEDD